MSQKLSFKNFLTIANKIHKNKYLYFEETFINSHIKTKIFCKEHGYFYKTPKKHIRSGQGCPNCSKRIRGLKRRSNLEVFIRKASEIHKNKYIYDQSVYTNTRIKIKIGCSEHGYFNILPNQHLHGQGCPKCAVLTTARKNTLSKIEVIKKFKEIHGNKYSYEKVEYLNRVSKVVIICPKHGEFFQTPGNHINGHGCPYCRNSIGEKEIADFLKSRGIKFERQKKFVECKFKRALPFDFYLPELNICIEFDGIQHFQPAFNRNNFNDIKRNDNIKNEFCIKNGLKLLRISYKEDIKKKLNNLLIYDYK